VLWKYSKMKNKNIPYCLKSSIF